MRRLAMLGLAVLVIGSNLGCVVAMGNKGSFQAQCGDRYPVVVNGEVYLVDVDKATTCKVPLSSGPCAVANCDDHDHDGK